jgi:hypothetical protein
MRSTKDFTSFFRGSSVFAVLLGMSLASLPVCAQDNAVYDRTGQNATHSTAFIDAFAVATVQHLPDICQTLFFILTTGRVAQTFERKMNWILGVLCERVGGRAGSLWLCDDAPERSS